MISIEKWTEMGLKFNKLDPKTANENSCYIVVAPGYAPREFAQDDAESMHRYVNERIHELDKYVGRRIRETYVDGNGWFGTDFVWAEGDGAFGLMIQFRCLCKNVVL